MVAILKCSEWNYIGWDRSVTSMQYTDHNHDLWSTELVKHIVSIKYDSGLALKVELFVQMAKIMAKCYLLKATFLIVLLGGEFKLCSDRSCYTSIYSPLILSDARDLLCAPVTTLLESSLTFIGNAFGAATLLNCIDWHSIIPFVTISKKKAMLRQDKTHKKKKTEECNETSSAREDNDTEVRMHKQ